MIVRVPVTPALLEWACARADLRHEDLVGKFPKLDAWIQQISQPTLKQLETFAKATRTPVGYFFLPLPPQEEIPIPDLRTVRNKHIDHPSPDLLDTIYVCQQRQEWFRDYARSLGVEKLDFIGSVRQRNSPIKTAILIRNALGFDIEARKKLSTWSDALRLFITQVEAIGVLVMINGVVGSNTHRPLNPDEFRGFALSDDLAPIIFINGSDTKSAQMFTLAHELAHLWLGKSGVIDSNLATIPDNETEVWCNAVAAEFLVPLAEIEGVIQHSASVDENVSKVAHAFKVSTLVAIRRLHDAGHLSKRQFQRTYQTELKRLQGLDAKRASGGNFLKTQPVRSSRRFTTAIIGRTLEGQTGFREAFRLLGFSKVETFHKLADELGVG